MDESYLMTTQVARQISKEHGVVIPPRVISDLLYGCKLPADATALIGGRTLIRPSAVPAIVDYLRFAGRLPQPDGSFRPRLKPGRRPEREVARAHH